MSSWVDWAPAPTGSGRGTKFCAQKRRGRFQTSSYKKSPRVGDIGGCEEVQDTFCQGIVGVPNFGGIRWLKIISQHTGYCSTIRECRGA